MISQWLYARQRDFTGGENLSNLPEKIGRNQLIRMENAIISPEGNVTDSWQLDTPLFTNVSTGLAIVPIAGSTLYRVYTATDAGVISFVFNPQSTTSYDLDDASGYTGYVLKTHASPVSIPGLTRGVPFLGKDYCIATTDLYIAEGELTSSSLAFGSVQNLTSKEISVTITNNTESNVVLRGATLTGTDAADFGHSGSFPQTVAASGTYVFPLLFGPTTTGSKTAVLNVYADIGILQVNITATAITDLTSNPSPISMTFAANPYGALIDFEVTNGGSYTPITLLSHSITGENSDVFEWFATLSDFSPLTINSFTTSGKGSIRALAPPAGTYNATLTLEFNVGQLVIAIQAVVS